MIRILLATAALLVVPATAVGQVDWRAGMMECEKLQAADAVAKCVRDTAAKLREEENKIADQNQPHPTGSFKLAVRETSSSVATSKGQTLGDKGASVSLQRKDGKDASVAKVALFGYGPAYLQGRVQPFVGASWLRDGASANKTDIRDLTVGSVGPLWQTPGAGEIDFTLLSTFQLTHREDMYGTNDGNLARAHFDLVWTTLAGGSLGGFSIVPQVAALWHRRSGGAATDGTWRSFYAGFVIAKPFAVGQQHFKASLLARKLYDTGVPAGNSERRDSYLNLSLDYLFFDPEDKKAALQPSLFVTREVGTDFLSGVAKANKTTAGFRLKFN